MLLDTISGPADLRRLSYPELAELGEEIRQFIVDRVNTHGGHLGSNLGVVELTLALHRVFDSPRDILLWDTGHQAYVHKIVTGRWRDFDHLRQPGGLSGYPSRAESAPRLGREQPRLDDPVLRPRPGHGRGPRPGRARAGGWWR